MILLSDGHSQSLHNHHHQNDRLQDQGIKEVTMQNTNTKWNIERVNHDFMIFKLNNDLYIHQ